MFVFCNLFYLIYHYTCYFEKKKKKKKYIYIYKYWLLLLILIHKFFKLIYYTVFLIYVYFPIVKC